MERIQADELVAFSGRLSDLDTETWLRKEPPLSTEECKELFAKVKALLAYASRAGNVGELPGTIDQLQRIKNELTAENATVEYPHNWHLIRALQERFMDDMGRCFLYALSQEDAELFDRTTPFGQKVYEAFPSATLDIEEAAKCLALHRGTAAVFHLMRVMEHGLRATANSLGVDYAPSWEAYLDQMKPLIEAKYRNKPPKWRKVERFFKEVYTYLHGVKRAWRNPTMHIEGTYTPEIADEIWLAVKSFMRLLSTEVSEKTKRRRDALLP